MKKTTQLGICTAFILIIVVQHGLNAQELHRYDDFENYEVGTTDIGYWFEQTCVTDPCQGCGVTPFIVTDEQARKGTKSVRLMKVSDDAALTGGDYCGYRVQFANYQDAIFGYNEHGWIGFSVYIADPSANRPMEPKTIFGYSSFKSHFFMRMWMDYCK
ncbi:MAG: hypothetical protein HC831_23615 [Chloroflexia bacterium]|nr:hypothetical protein [Chloroflexia bacterium]